MKFVRLNEGSDKKIQNNFSSIVGKYILFYRNGYFIGKLVEAFDPSNYQDCKFMFSDVHHLKGKFITLDEFSGNLEFKKYETWIIPDDKKWEDVSIQRICSEQEIIAIEVISEIYYNESLERILINKCEEGISIGDMMDKLNKTYKVDVTLT